ncbi:hypothetical protein Salmuc_04579 [Salipiger mucosus DSM 16094]|uniref:Uncharacterized protein n=1 Tax=Salipiger mucosus DSM 16094 TaxID=1123237 RepID=S9Q2Y0_9RHOB|nr:hypothetical protein Salmuc_04579 [Salipiger mucosus DSM 16094]
MALAARAGIEGLFWFEADSPFSLHVQRNFNLNGRQGSFCGCEIRLDW